MSPRCPIFSTSWVNMTCTRSLPPHHVRQKRHLAGALDRDRGLALVLRAEAGDPSGTDLATVRGEPSQHVVVLVVNVGNVLLAEHARLALARAPLCTRAPSPTHSKPPYPETSSRPRRAPAAACGRTSVGASRSCAAARRQRRAGCA